MIYRVSVDGEGIYDDDTGMSLLDPEVTVELNAAGSFQFTLPRSHPFYFSPKILTQDVEVYEDDQLIWFGRPLDISNDVNSNKVVYCEGALAYFNDSVQRYHEYEEVSLHEFFGDLITNHNSQVPLNRQFTVGDITVQDHNVYRKLDFHKTIDALQTMCLDTDGGYFFLRKVNGVQYIDWLYEMPYEGTQPISYAINIKELNEKISGGDIATCVIPIGMDESGNRLTIATANNGLDYIDTDAVEEYGRISYVLQRDDLTDAASLLEAGQVWITQQQFDKLVIECQAAELHYLNNEYSAFMVGQNVHVTSTPHMVDATLPIVKMVIRLDDPVKTITIGTLDRKELSSIVKEGTESSASNGAKVYFDETPMEGSNRAVTSAGIYAALGNIRFSINPDRTVKAISIDDDPEENNG